MTLLLKLLEGAGLALVPNRAGSRFPDRRSSRPRSGVTRVLPQPPG